MKKVISCSPGSTVALLLALMPHSKKILGSLSEFTCSPPACLSSLWVLQSNPQQNMSISSIELVPGHVHCPMLPQDGLDAECQLLSNVFNFFRTGLFETHMQRSRSRSIGTNLSLIKSNLRMFCPWSLRSCEIIPLKFKIPYTESFQFTCSLYHTKHEWGVML